MKLPYPFQLNELKNFLQHIKTQAVVLLTLLSHKSQTKRHKTAAIKKTFANGKQFLMERENHFNLTSGNNHHVARYNCKLFLVSDSSCYCYETQILLFNNVVILLNATILICSFFVFFLPFRLSLLVNFLNLESLTIL